MPVLITGGSSPIAVCIAARLHRAGTDVRLTDRRRAPPPRPPTTPPPPAELLLQDTPGLDQTPEPAQGPAAPRWFQTRTGGLPEHYTRPGEAVAGAATWEAVLCEQPEPDAAATRALFKGVSVLIHTEALAVADAAGGGSSSDDGDSSWLDVAARGTYTWLGAAVSAGSCRHCICLSSIGALYEAYSPSVEVAPFWAPRPGCKPADLAPYLAEFVARQFAHTGALPVAVMRLGVLSALNAGDGRAGGGGGRRSRWVTTEDALEAALRAELGRHTTAAQGGGSRRLTADASGLRGPADFVRAEPENTCALPP
jgi:nucleoside-diphosphate-sugar epimerase